MHYSPLQLLQALPDDIFTDEQGITFQSRLLPPPAPAVIASLKQQWPGSFPAEIEAILNLTSGFTFAGLEDISFTSLNSFGLEALFPDTLELMKDGLGNSWLLDITPSGAGGAVYFASHDPAVLLLQAMNLSQFLYQLTEYGSNPQTAQFSLIYNKLRFSVAQSSVNLWDIKTAKESADPVLAQFATTLPSHYVVADLRHKMPGVGFSLKNLDTATAIRQGEQALWGISRKEKKSFFARLFGRK